MADRIYFSINGINEVIKDLKMMSEGINNKVVGELHSSALRIQSEAKKKVPVNMGTLRNSIQLTENINKGTLVYEIGSKLNYAPYMEFGTGGKVSIPSGYNDFAGQFKGKSTGGNNTFKDLLLAIAKWVQSKGIVGNYSVKTQRRLGSKSAKNTQNMSAAYAIAINILRKGLKPQPYLIPAYEAELPKLKKKINEITQNVKS